MGGGYLRRTEEDIRCPGGRVTGICELSNIYAGTQILFP